MIARAAVVAAALAVASGAALAQQVGGRAFEDRDADGIADAGEPGLSGVAVELLGTRDAGGAFDQTATTAPDGAYSLAPGAGCYLLAPQDPVGWRLTTARADRSPEGAPGYTFPVGRPRVGKLDGALDRLRAGSLRYTSMGDSIAWNWNVCGYPESFWYSKQVRARLACAAPGAAVTLDSAAVKGEHTDDLLVDDIADLNNVFRVLEVRPELVTISMIGNDLLGVDAGNNPTQADTNRAVVEVLDARANLQEAVSAMIAEIDDLDVSLNTLYDNLTYRCYDGVRTTSFHRNWLPIINHSLRELAWGQARRVSVNEVAAEFAQEDQNSACTGFDRQICRDLFGLDNIHPNNDGYTQIREKVWEGIGGVQLGPKDPLARASQTADFGFLRRVRRLTPIAWETRNGAAVETPEAAFDLDDGGAAARIDLGVGSEEFRLAGFPDWFDEVAIVKVIAGVRYRTSGTFADDLYRVEASTTGTFRPPAGHAYTPTDWNYYTPLVGGGGPNAPAENADYPEAKLLVRPQVAAYREVSSTLTKNPILPTGGGEYVWPPLTHQDLAAATIRVAAAPVGTAQGIGGRVELDGAWLDVYGWERPRPVEAANLRAARLADGSLELTFDAVPGAARHNAYFGALAAVRGGDYDHGAGARCAAPTTDAGGGRRRMAFAAAEQPAGNVYVLVTGHVDDVESPAGFSTSGVEIDRSQSICR